MLFTNWNRSFKLASVVRCKACEILNEFPNDLIVAYNKLLEEESQPIDGTRQPSVVYTRAAGRPSIDIPRQTLKMYLKFGFSLIKTSEMLGVSQKTISRRIRQFGLLEEVPRYTEISNENLDTVVAEIYHEFPNCVIRRMKGFLNAKSREDLKRHAKT